MQNVIMNKVQELHEQIATAKHNLGKPQPLAANFTKKLHSISFLSNLISFFAGAEIFGVRFRELRESSFNMTRGGGGMNILKNEA